MKLLVPLWERPITDWLAWLKAAGKPMSTIKLRRTQIRRLADTLPTTEPRHVSTEQLTEWLASHTWSPETLRSHRAALRSFYGFALATGRIERNPAAMLPTVRTPAGKPRPAPEHVVKTSVIGADPRDRLMIRLAAEAGLRCCEIARIHTRDVEPDFVGFSLRVIGKGNRVRIIPLSPRLALDLRSYQYGWIFPGKIDGHLSAAYVSKRISRAMPDDYTAHTLRHRFASVAYSAERDLRAVQELLGHSMPETTARYTAIPDGAKRAAVLAAVS